MGKKGLQRLRQNEKQYIVNLIAQGKSESEIVKTIARQFKKKVTTYQVRYYSRTRREEIIGKRENEIELASNVDISCLAYRLQQLQALLEDLLNSKPLDGPSIRYTLQLADMMMDRAYRRLARRRVMAEDDSEDVIDFLEVKRRLRVTKRSIKEMKAMEKLVGWQWRN